MEELEQNKKQLGTVRSQQLNDILGRIPQSIFVRSNVIVILVVAGMVSLLFLLKYPRMVPASVVVTGQIPPMELVARQSGRIEKIFVSNDCFVTQNTPLVIIESSASYDDMLYLNELLKEYQQLDEYYFMIDSLRKNLQLGNYQQAYTDFIREHSNYRNLIGMGYFPARLDALHKEYAYYARLLKQLNKNENTLLSDYRLSQTQYQRDSLLEQKGVISPSVLEISESTMLKKLKDYQSKSEERIAVEMKQSSIHQQILQIQLQMKLEYAQSFNILEQKFELLKSEVERWKNHYMLMAPIDGRVAYYEIWAENQNITAGEVAISVVPTSAFDSLTGRLKIAIYGAGRIQLGNKVLIKFDDFPYLEFGMVIGELVKVSRVSVNNSYYGEVSIRSLTTTRSVVLPFRDKMSGTAEIVTDQQRLIDYILEPLKSGLYLQRQLSAGN